MTATEKKCGVCEKNDELNDGNVLLTCTQCSDLSKHVSCIRTETNEEVTLKGDVFFDLICSNCSKTEHDQLFRSRISWLCAILLSLYNLHINGTESNQGYFHWKQDICKFIADHWATLFGPKCRKKKTWQGVVSGNLSSNMNRLFVSGISELGLQGWWKLKTLGYPWTLLEKSKLLPPLEKSKKPSHTTTTLLHDLSSSVVMPITEPILLKRESRNANLGSSMLNAMALKEKRDSVAIPNQTVKRKRRLKDDLSRKSLKKSGNKIVSVSDFENHWKMVKVGHKFVTMPKNATVISQGKLSSTSKVIISKNETVPIATNFTNLKRPEIPRTYSRKPRPPSTVTRTLAIKTRQESTDFHDLSDPFGGELKIDLSPRITDNIDAPRPDTNLNTASLLSPLHQASSSPLHHDSISSSTSSPLHSSLASSPVSPAPPHNDTVRDNLTSDDRNSPASNPLVFLPQYELSHLDLGREVTLGDSFTRLEDSENSDQFLLAVRVEDCHHQDLNESTTAADSNNDFHEEAFVIISNDAEAAEEGDAEQFVHHPGKEGEVTISEEGTDERTTTADHDSCLKYESNLLPSELGMSTESMEETDICVDEAMAEALVDRTSQPSLADLLGEMDDQADDFIEKQDAKEKNAPLKKDSLTPNQGPITSTFIESPFTRNQKEHKPMNNHSSISKPRESEANSKSRVLDRFQRVPTPSAASPIMNHGIFLSKQAEEEDLDFVNSRYSGQLIRPYIRRDFDVVPRKLQLLRAVQERTADRQRLPLTDHPLDFCFIQEAHIPAVNNLALQLFWTGIDMSDALEYPEFSCVVLYRKLVVGFGVVVPDTGWTENYLSYFMVHPDWSGAGIGSLMLYHLIECSAGKDLTLHVSASNPALILYQKFGFKVEEFVRDFYARYLPLDSRESTHALYMRLAR